MGDVAPVLPTGEIVGEKAQSPIRETMARYARARGYPEALVQAMVTKEIQVWRLELQDEPPGTFTYVTDAELRDWPEEERARIVEKKLLVAAGRLLTMDAQKAVEYGFARQAVTDEQGLFEVLQLDPQRVERLYLTGSERVLTYLDLFSPLLIVGGIILLFIEVSNPGFGLPGIAGLACFAVFFLIKWTLNYAQMLEIVLFAAGVVLLMVEVLLIPGFGVAGITGIVLIFVSLVLAFQQFTWPQSGGQVLSLEYNLLKVTGAFAASGLGVAVLARFLPSVPLLGRMVHRGDMAAAHAGELVETRTPGRAGWWAGWAWR
jgi:membrane-bound serine protease (ClpP class)